MKLVFYSPNFYPLVGGLEGFLMDLADSLTHLNVHVTVVTLTPYNKEDNFAFTVLRNPSLSVIRKEILSADYFLQFNVSLKGIPPWLFSRRKLVVVHQNVVGKGVRENIKQWVADNFSHLNIGCSEYIAKHYKRSLPIPNAYNAEEFHNDKPWEMRPNDLLYVGRLVSDKGCDTLLRGLAILKNAGAIHQLNIIGKGEEEPKLRALTQELNLENQVTFWGQLPRKQLNVIMNEHKILVVPSRYEEPFGIVALEGLAAGCLTIVSEFGGLREAVGKCGLTFPNGDAVALAASIKQGLTDKILRENCFKNVASHLAEHTKDAIAKKYFNVLYKIEQA